MLNILCRMLNYFFSDKTGFEKNKELLRRLITVSLFFSKKKLI